MVPQWPRVVEATMLQSPSNWAAIAGGAEQIIAEAADRAMAHIRLPIMGVLTRCVVLLVTSAVLGGGARGRPLNSAACANRR